ncbi:hypothetical protein BABINDRAFT_160613 [Babjeviella inositovora NRRL Y-12698]|uniref:RRM domain-containing protein n=1 Tax=Babjeviella inositovora NRRL Y-12698 TaxID=984486 RepID=A0A1E3QU72_9ASCO|nr:uncharacterized protein BABINDRAFT_160613 [Babjeviella inositovora NRRL Y-12698]ODQ81233.1 hypothetical protein BABINDRAFT_160613 [Babjeviella inositovora NRRL Y-12698]
MNSYPSNGGISKPQPKKKSQLNTSRSSDRRLAAGKQPAAFLHNALTNQPKPLPYLIQRQNGPSVPQYTLATPTSDVPEKIKTVKRSGGGKTWEDASLMEWDPKHFRLFVGNLGVDATDELLGRAFSAYPSLSKVKVPMDPKSQANKGYGFVAFADSSDYLKAFKEMNGKYVGQRPVQLKRAETVIKPVTVKRQGNKRR